jgi:hypothetical protein
MPLDEDLSRYTAPPDPIGSEPDDHDPADDRHDPDGLEPDYWAFAETIDIEPHPSDL